MTQSIVFPEIDHTLKFYEGLLVVPKNWELKKEFVIPQNFSSDKPVYLEFCSGNGEWIVGRAKQEKDRNWIAVEMRFDRLRKIWKKAKRFELDNLLCIWGEAFRTAHYLIESSSIDEIFINFPDPWPKRRHAKNRLIQKNFLDEVHRILKPGGKITFVTDDETYAIETKKEFTKHFGFKRMGGEYENYGSSFFKRLWQEMGKIIHYQSFQKQVLPNIITLASGMKSSLDWSQQVQVANQVDEVIWHFDFDVCQPLDDEAQLACLQLALDHFKDTILPTFSQKTKGAILYQGQIPVVEKNYEDWLFDRGLLDSKFNLKQHSRDVFLDFLKLLMVALPVEVEPYICLDLSDLSLKEQLLFVSYEPLWDFKVALKGTPSFLAPYLWDEGIIKMSDSLHSNNAFLIPSIITNEFLSNFEQKIKDFKGQSFKLCFEDRFNMQWDELENLFIDSKSLSPTGKRMLQGFEAAGGNLFYF